MRVIIAHLNSNNALSRTGSFMLKNTCDALHIKEPSKVFTHNKLMEKLEEYKDHPILLITNYPPDSSYPESGKSIREEDGGDIINRYWEADSYDKSHNFFKEFLTKYNFKAIHFLTGTPESMLADSFFESVLEDTKITVTRRSRLIVEGKPYDEMYLNFLLSKIKASV